MRQKVVMSVTLLILAVGFQLGCATKKYVRNRVAERVQPLENRTSELEETSRRNTQQISELSRGIDDVRTRTGRAQETADRAAAAAEQANTRVASVERNLDDLRANLDKYTVQQTAMVFFRPGSTVLTPEGRAQLDHLASQISDRNGFILEIVGYGDIGRSARANQPLAQLRAEAVQRYLADRHNIPIMRMFSLGLGTSSPTGTRSVSTSEGGIGRMVEIRLLTSNAAPGSTVRTTGSSSD